MNEKSAEQANAMTSGVLPDRFSTGPEQPRLSMRHRLARLGSRPPQMAVLEPLFKVVRHNHPKADTALIERAYRTAEHYHRGQTRKSGDPYITHPLAVTTILAELGMTEPTLCAALLHDTVEDTSYTLQQLGADFGDEVAAMVDGVTKLDKVQYGSAAQAETIRKMVIAMSQDIRVLVIKLADRLHNMRTLHYLRPDKQVRIAKETINIFAPLAHRLGMNAVKWELEDLAFAILHPKVYDEIVHLVADRAPSREAFLRNVTEQVEADLRTAKIRATVQGRPKHYYSIYQKMVVRGRDFSDIYDLVALRILVDTPRDCYAALGVMHVRWNPLPGRFKDYIAMPKFNMYQSLHTTVLGPQGKPVELQIRTHEMHRRAEYGVAAHWKYKEAQRGGPASNLPVNADGSSLNWVRSLTEWQKETSDPDEFLDSLRFEINTGEVYVYTPRGDVMSLPEGSTPVDFAYAIHTEVGHSCIGARVNGRLVPLESKLNNGDMVDVLTSKAESAGPSRDWLEFVASPRARSKIKHYFTKERREEAIEAGKNALAKQLRRSGLGVQKFLTVEHLTALSNHFRVHGVDGLYAAVGEGGVSAQAVVQRLIGFEGGPEAVIDHTSEDASATARLTSVNESGVAVHGDTDLWVKLAKCCTPVPGDEIIGFVTRGAGVSVHRRDCTNATNLMAHPERMVDVSWAPTAESSFLVAVQIEGLDRHGLLSEITRSVADFHVNILSATISTSRDRIFKAKITFETPDPTHLDALLRTIRQVPGIYEVYRVTQ